MKKQNLTTETEEQKKARLEAAAVKAKELQNYQNSLPGKSYRQLRGDLRRESRVPTDTCLLTQAFATVLLTVLENTEPNVKDLSKVNASGKIAAYLR